MKYKIRVKSNYVVRESKDEFYLTDIVTPDEDCDFELSEIQDVLHAIIPLITPKTKITLEPV